MSNPKKIKSKAKVHKARVRRVRNRKELSDFPFVPMHIRVKGI